MHIGKRAAIMDIGADAIWQFTSRNRCRGIGRVERDGNVNFSITKKLAKHWIICRIGIARPP